MTKRNSTIEAPATIEATTEVKRGRGRPQKYFTDADRKAAANLSVRKSQAKKAQELKDLLDSLSVNSRLSKATRAAVTQAAARVHVPKIGA